MVIIMDSFYLGEYNNEPLEWHVVTKTKDGYELVVLKVSSIQRAYNESNVPVDWSSCTLRKWLNLEFYKEAFSEKERLLIVERPTPDNYDDMSGGKEGIIKDKVFILSYDNIQNNYYSRVRFSSDKAMLLRGFGSKSNKIFVIENGRTKEIGVDDRNVLVYPAMWIRRKSLYECMCDTIPGTMTLDFLKDDSKSAEYIRNTLKDQNYVHPEQNAAVYSIAQGRARHSAVTFLLGLVFQNFHLFEKIFTPIDVKVKNIEDANKYIWLRSALYHDIGMTSDLILKRNLSLKNDFKHYLYTDDYDDLIELNEYISKSNGVLAFSYSEILRYGLYIKNERHKKNADTVEKDRLEYKSRGIIDHGILGGSILFDRYAEKLHGFELKVLKVVSLTISQHNMYKADADSDSAYRKYGLNKLLSTSNYKLSSQTPLLLFLSLIDTIECVKTFSKGNNPDKYLETITVLKSIYISVDRNTIRIDYSQLKRN